MLSHLPFKKTEEGRHDGVERLGLLAAPPTLRLRREQDLALGEYGGLDFAAELRMRLEKGGVEPNPFGIADLRDLAGVALLSRSHPDLDVITSVSTC